MNHGKQIVATSWGTGEKVERVSFSLYDENDENAANYCETINDLALGDNKWVFAQVIPDNTPYLIEVFLPVDFEKIILGIGNRNLQKILRDADASALAMALKGTETEVQEKMFRNMSKRAPETQKHDMSFTPTM